MDAFVAKPIDVEVLVGVMERSLANRASAWESVVVG
jgi:hypothetical protein